jgi:hypothetical protein
LKSQPGFNFFTNFCTNSYKQIYTIDTNCVVQIRTQCGFCTNSDIFFTNCIVRIHTTSRKHAARGGAKPKHTSCLDQIAPGCPNL